jgi:hypothetical protein
MLYTNLKIIQVINENNERKVTDYRVEKKMCLATEISGKTCESSI